MQYTIVRTPEDGTFITVYVRGRGLESAGESHPNFERIVEGALADDESVFDLFNLSQVVASKFESLSERVSVANGRVYFDGVEVNDALTDQILRFIDTNEKDYMPLVNFFENVQQNPQEYSREQLFTWLRNREFSITHDGMIVGYKGVRTDGEGMTSISTGTAVVNQEVKSGAIPYAIGDVVEMPRDQVAFDPSNGCSTGLHVGTYDYASGFAQGALLEVHVNPRDVVSVPEDSYHQKMRVCRFRVVDIINAPHTVPVVRDYEDEDDDQDSGDSCPECGEWAFDWYCDSCDTYV